MYYSATRTELHSIALVISEVLVGDSDSGGTGLFCESQPHERSWLINGLDLSNDFNPMNLAARARCLGIWVAQLEEWGGMKFSLLLY